MRCLRADQIVLGKVKIKNVLPWNSNAPFFFIKFNKVKTLASLACFPWRVWSYQPVNGEERNRRSSISI